MAVKTILPVCNAYKRAQHPPIKAEVFQNVVFGQIQSRHIIGNRQILRRSFNHAPLNETSGRGPTRKLRTVSGKGPVFGAEASFDTRQWIVGSPPPTVAAKLLAGRIRPITDVMGTLVCNAMDATQNTPGTSMTANTASVQLNAQGDAEFFGTIQNIPAPCNNPLFLVRIATQATGAVGRWIATGTERTIGD